MEYTSLQLSSVMKICSVLKEVLSTSLGPRPAQTMLTSSSGKMLLTSDGHTILESLHVSHPLLQLVMRSVTAHHKATGDGCKTLVLMLWAFLREASLLTNSSRESYNLYQASFKFKDIFEEKFLPSLQSFSVSSKSNLGDPDSGDIFSLTLRNIGRTSMQGRCPDTIADTLTNLLCDYLKKCFQSAENMSACITDCVADFSTTCVKVEGQHTQFSQLVGGIIITRDLAVDSGLSASKDAIHFIYLNCSLGDVAGESNTIVNLDSSHLNGLGDIFKWQHTLIRNIITSYKALGINLILCSDAVSDMAKHLCREQGISIVTYIPEEEMSRLSKMTGILPVSNIQELVSISDVGYAKCLKMILLNQRRCIQLMGVKMNNAILAHQILLYAPMDSLANVYEILLMNALKTIKVWLTYRNIHEPQHQANYGSLQSSEFSVVHSNADENLGATIPAGGTVELFMHNLLEKYRLQCQDADVAVFCRALASAYLALPSALFNSIEGSGNTNNRSFIKARTDFHQDIEKNVVRPFLQHRGNYKPLETLSGKIVLLYNLLELLQQILKLDAIVGVKKL